MTKTYKICTLPGDGIGPEIIAEGVKVLNARGREVRRRLRRAKMPLIGGRAIDATGEATAPGHARCRQRIGCGAACCSGRPEVGHHRP